MSAHCTHCYNYCYLILISLAQMVGVSVPSFVVRTAVVHRTHLVLCCKITLAAMNTNWQRYLWYIPGIINTLRGLGVFFILIVLPKDSRYYLLELCSSVWEKCGGKPLKGLLPPTRRSSTSTNTTATTSTNLSPTAAVDKERISLSSSDTQLSSHNASMNELQDANKKQRCFV